MSILDPLIVSPRLPRFYEQIGALLQAERERRDDFYERVTEHT